MKFVNEGTFVEDKEQITISLNKNGQQVETDKEKVFAKAIVGQGRTLYYVRFYAGILYDPIGVHSSREYWVDSKFRTVDKNTYDFYTLYLQTNNQVYLSRAQRGAINE
jgi:hypothetical protein